MRARRDALTHSLDPLPGGQLPELLFCFVSGLTGGVLIAGGQKRDADSFRVRENCADDLQLQGGKVREAVEKDLAAVQKLRLIQKLAQAHLPRDGVAAARFADGQVAFIQQRQLCDLLRQPPFEPRGGCIQCVRRDAGGQKLLHERAELL